MLITNKIQLLNFYKKINLTLKIIIFVRGKIFISQ